jgi:hypothetical protein
VLDGRRVLWTIEAIPDGLSLVEEGRAMHHCVALYGPSVARGRSSIWSMKRSVDGAARRALTIQVRPASREIVQVRGACNRRPKEAELRVLASWAAENDLRFRGC